MGSKVILKKDNDVLFTDEFDVNLNTDEFIEKTNNFNFEAIEGEEKEIFLDGVKVYFGNLNIKGFVEIELNYDTPFLMITFEIEGNTVFTPKNNENRNVNYTIKTNEYNFFYIPKMKGTLVYKTNKRKYFSLFFTEEYVKNIFKNNFTSVSASFGKALQNKKPFIMFKNSQPIPFNLFEIINEIKNCCYANQIKEVYIQSKIMEIFSHLFSELNKTKKEKRVLNKRDLYLVKKAEKIVKNNLTKRLTLDSISQQIRSNKFKLKKDFKSVYGESIFSYQMRLRMEKSKEMIIKTDATIAEISYTVGYKNPQHFTTAFKKKFNFLPSDLKKEFH